MRKMPCLSWKKLAKTFTGVLYQFSTIRKTSVTEDIIGWPLPNKRLGCATEKDQCNSRFVGQGVSDNFFSYAFEATITNISSFCYTVGCVRVDVLKKGFHAGYVECDWSTWRCKPECRSEVLASAMMQQRTMHIEHFLSVQRFAQVHLRQIFVRIMVTPWFLHSFRWLVPISGGCSYQKEYSAVDRSRTGVVKLRAWKNNRVYRNVHRRTRRGGGRPPRLEKFQDKPCFQGKSKLLKNPEW